MSKKNVRTHTSWKHKHGRVCPVAAQGLGVAPFEELSRDTHSFSRRVGELPKQQESDGEWDFRGVLHRDGTVFSSVTLAELSKPEVGGRAMT